MNPIDSLKEAVDSVLATIKARMADHDQADQADHPEEQGELSPPSSATSVSSSLATAPLPAPPPEPSQAPETPLTEESSSSPPQADHTPSEAEPPQASQPPSKPSVWVSVTLMNISECVSVQVPVVALADFLNLLGQETVQRQLSDPQFWLQKRSSKRKDESIVISGIVLDVDKKETDPLKVVQQSGLPMPTLWFHTIGGYRVVFVFDCEVGPDEFRRVGKTCVVALDGADPASWETTQANRLPTCLRTTADGIVNVTFSAQMANPVPVSPDAFFKRLPVRLERAIGGTYSLSDAERAQVEDYLDEEGIPVPDEPGSKLVDRCPEKQHSKKCCYINREEDGTITLRCLGGHNGAGQKNWSERDLFKAATGKFLPETTIDPIRDIPVTWAGVTFVKQQCQELFENHTYIEKLVQAALDIWKYHHALREIEKWGREAERLAREENAEISIPPTIEDWERIYSARLYGIDAAGPFHLFFDQVSHTLKLQPELGVATGLASKGTSLSEKKHAHEWAVTSVYRIGTRVEKRRVGPPGKKVEKKFVVKCKTTLPYASSLFNKIIIGYQACLRVLGVGLITPFEFPVAHVEEEWSVNPQNKAIEAVKPPTILVPKSPVDVVAFFLKMYKAGRLPLASENDVLLLIMALASPLLRDLLAGLLGVYWLLGPSGAGKDFLAEMLSAIWARLSTTYGKVKFDLTLVGDEEMRKTFAMAGDALYARAKEAGKNWGIIDRLIRLAGTDIVSARGLYKNEYNVRNTFTYLADSVENLPERKEISRRTVMINVAHVDDKVSKGELLSEVIENGPAIICDLKRLVETKPQDWYRHQADTGSRPLGPVALAKLLGAKLQEVTGGSLDELFEAMLGFAQQYDKEEGENERSNARPDKDPNELSLVPSFRVAKFIELTKDVPGYQEIFKRIKSKRIFEITLDREADYADVKGKRKPYLPVEIGSKWYAFKLLKQARNFVLMDEDEYCAKVGVQKVPRAVPVTTTDGASNEPAGEDPPSQVNGTQQAPGASDDELTFSDDELLDGVKS